MNQNDINRAFTEKVAELLSRGCQIYPGERKKSPAFSHGGHLSGVLRLLFRSICAVSRGEYRQSFSSKSPV